MLEIRDLKVDREGVAILRGIDLSVCPGHVHALMGPNGAGKSTLARVLAGDPEYEVVAGEVWFKGQNLLLLPPEQRAALGLFMGFQYPVEIPGIRNEEFLRAASDQVRRARNLPPLTQEAFELLLDAKMQQMEVKGAFKTRGINEGFSGGEKKKSEIVQMLLLEPSLALLDETDSGLDIDAMRIVAQGIHQFRSQENALLLITHYQRLLEYVKPDFVHVVMEGRIVQSGGFELVLALEEHGYEGVCHAH